MQKQPSGNQELDKKIFLKSGEYIYMVAKAKLFKFLNMSPAPHRWTEGMFNFFFFFLRMEWMWWVFFSVLLHSSPFFSTTCSSLAIRTQLNENCSSHQTPDFQPKDIFKEAPNLFDKSFHYTVRERSFYSVLITHKTKHHMRNIEHIHFLLTSNRRESTCQISRPKKMFLHTRKLNFLAYLVPEVSQ